MTQNISCTIPITDKERQILQRALELVPDGVTWLTAEEFEALRRKLEMAAAVTLPPDGKPTKRFYVSMTWEQWPDCGSYGDVFEAADEAEAEAKCRDAMEACGGDAEYRDDWHLVDCYDLAVFIKDYIDKPATGKPDPSTWTIAQCQHYIDYTIGLDVNTIDWLKDDDLDGWRAEVLRQVEASDDEEEATCDSCTVSDGLHEAHCPVVAGQCWIDGEGEGNEYDEEAHDMLFEYDLAYTGGDYSGVGETAVVPSGLIEEHGEHEAFRKHTGIDPVHIVNIREADDGGEEEEGS